MIRNLSLPSDGDEVRAEKSVKSKIMKKKNELKSNSINEIKKVKVMNFKTQEQILNENALRNILAILPTGHLYELIGNMRLVTK